jgi:hypothetical protein
MKWSREESERRRKIEAERRKDFMYNVSFTNDELTALKQVMMLNRRMLDRSPEHSFFDRVLTDIVVKIDTPFKAAFPKWEPFDSF